VFQGFFQTSRPTGPSSNPSSQILSRADRSLYVIHFPRIDIPGKTSEIVGILPKESYLTSGTVQKLTGQLLASPTSTDSLFSLASSATYANSDRLECCRLPDAAAV